MTGEWAADGDDLYSATWLPIVNGAWDITGAVRIATTVPLAEALLAVIAHAVRSGERPQVPAADLAAVLSRGFLPIAGTVADYRFPDGECRVTRYVPADSAHARPVR